MLLTVVTVAGCSSDPAPAGAPKPVESSTPTSTPASTPAQPTPTVSATAEPPPAPEPRTSYLSVPALGLEDFPVRRYPGSPDDAPGTAIQNRGDMASPRGARGGVGPGEVGNHIVTGHRLTSTQPFRHLPSLAAGSRVLVRVRDVVHVYEVRRTRWTSFRSTSSLAAQRAPVPGRPGVKATRAMITLSTCATIEDHAAGNYWADEFDNPEHRIDKIGVLVATRRA
ncbi:sortase [Nocardioides piscis]|uniref:Sortase n=2 Tax=Nocardioides piscis TaxID=2714938 RepID=A0A6G7YKQ3_9ACTN|nr:sortase [Nocardioides piscis]